MVSSDGVTGELRVLPTESESRSRLAGNGTAGFSLPDDLTHAEHREVLRAGDAATVHSWELVTSVDGPGTRLTVFLTGCPLRCRFCHNPDTMFAAKGNVVTCKEIEAKLRRYRGIFRATKGGLTVSGGEPLQQPAFVEKLFAAAHELGIHTALDTSGFLGVNATDALLANTDLVLLDIKSGLPDTYRDVTGAELEPTLAFARRLTDLGIEIWIRFVCVPDVTDGEENVQAVADFVATLPTVSRVEVLPFHQMGRDKWDALGMEYTLRDTPTPSPQIVERIRGQFAAHGLTVY